MIQFNFEFLEASWDVFEGFRRALEVSGTALGRLLEAPRWHLRLKTSIFLICGRFLKKIGKFGAPFWSLFIFPNRNFGVSKGYPR